MEATFTHVKSFILFVILSLGLVCGEQAWARTTTLEHEQATLISKFAKYVTWPTEARQREFVIGVYDDIEKYNYFNSFFANKGIRGKDIIVRLVQTTSEAEEVNILYIPSINQNKFMKLTDKISGSHVLIISEESKYNQNTMVDISYDEDDAKIVLKVNDDAIKSEDLIMPELSYFLDDKTDEEVLTVSPTALENQRVEELAVLQKQITKQNEALQAQATQQKALLNELNEKLTLSKENLEKNDLALQKNAVRLKLAEQENEKKNQDLKSQEKKLKQLETQLEAQQVQLDMTKQSALSSSEEQTLDKTAEQIQEEAEAESIAVTELTEKLKKQENITKNTLAKLSNITKENDSLSSFQTLFYLFLLIALVALGVAFLMWNKAKRLSSMETKSVPDNTTNPVLPMREKQLIRSENLAALSYIATDITYAASLSLDDFKVELESAKDTKNIAKIKPIITLLDNFNLIAADQDDTKIQVFDIVSYLKNMMMLYEFEFSQCDIVYSYNGEKELTVKSVPGFITIALINLINNSLKHGFDNKGKGKIALKIEKGSKSGAIITYTDDGKGMSKATLKQVFEPFFTTRSDRGYVGVGMSTTYDLIKHKLAGDIKIDSQEGKGTTVTINLP